MHILLIHISLRNIGINWSFSPYLFTPVLSKVQFQGQLLMKALFSEDPISAWRYLIIYWGKWSFTFWGWCLFIRLDRNNRALPTLVTSLAFPGYLFWTSLWKCKKVHKNYLSHVLSVSVFPIISQIKILLNL